MFHNGSSDGAQGRSSAPAPSAGAAARPRKDPRRLILDATIDTVARRGYERTTVSRILSEAGVVEAVFREHFYDKQDCFMQAIEELASGVERRALEQFERQAPWVERVRSALGALLEALAKDAEAARVAFVETLAAGPVPRERHHRALALFTSLMEEGRSQAPNPAHLSEQTSEAVVGGIASILHRHVSQGETATLPSLHNDLTYFALLPYMDQERAFEAARLGPPV